MPSVVEGAVLVLTEGGIRDTIAVMVDSRQFPLSLKRAARVLLVLFPVACGGHSTISVGVGGAPGSAASCPVGEERCGCYANSACNDGLICLSDLCVLDPNSDTGGMPGLAGAPGGAGTGASGTAGSASAAGSSDPIIVGGSSQSGPNLITNGDFSDGQSDWGVTTLGMLSPVDGVMIVDGALCATLGSMTTVLVLGWPKDTSQAAQLDSGKVYTLSFDARGTGPLNVNVTAKVGLAVSPYTEDFSEIDDIGADNVVRTFTHSHAINPGDQKAGVALQLTSAGAFGTSTVCIDNVLLFEAQ
jgi:hypothetical protein